MMLALEEKEMEQNTLEPWKPTTNGIKIWQFVVHFEHLTPTVVLEEGKGVTKKTRSHEWIDWLDWFSIVKEQNPQEGESKGWTS